MATLMVNPQTKKGYEWARMPAGSVCLSKSYSNVQLYSNISFDAKSFVDIKSAPRADDKGNGKDYSTMGINAQLILSKNERQYPMYSANVDDILNLEKKTNKTPAKYIKYLVGNSNTKEGTIVASAPSGSLIEEYYNVVGTPEANDVKFGAIFTPVGEGLVGLKPSQPKIDAPQAY